MRKTTAIVAALGASLLAGSHTGRSWVARVVGRTRLGWAAASRRSDHVSAAPLLERSDLRFVPTPHRPIR